MDFKRILRVRDGVNLFISEHPSVLILSGLILSIALYLSGLKILWLGILWAVVIGKKRFFSYLLPFCTFVYAALFFYIGNISSIEDEKGRARIHIHEVNFVSSTFGRSWVYKGLVEQFKAESGKTFRRLPFTLYLPKPIKRPLANSDYWVEARLIKSDFYGYKLKLDKDASFERVAKSWSMAERRYESKKKFRRFVHKHIPFKNARVLLVGMATGDFQDTFLSYTFSRFGLNHLLAISGFHFALLALFLTFLLKFTPLKFRLVSLAVLLSLFYFFVGYGPSLQRAWVVALVYLWSSYQNRLVTSVNILSIAMIVVLTLNHFMLAHLGFQFSFMVTFAILIYYAPFYDFLKKIFVPKSFVDKGVIKSIALGCAVHIAAIPISLFHFHKFYWMGFIFNLIVPAGVSLILFGFMSFLALSLIIPKLPLLGLYYVGFVTEKMVQAIYWIPTSIDYCTRVPVMPSYVVLIYIFLFFIVGANIQGKKEFIILKHITS